MEVILLERVAKLGQMGDVVTVKPGYARNYLLLQGKALTASEANIKHFEAQKAQLEARNLETRKEAEALGDRLGGHLVSGHVDGGGELVSIEDSGDGGALRVDGRRVVGHAGGDEFIPLGPVGLDLGKPFAVGLRRAGMMFPPVEFANDLAEKRPHIRHQAERHRIVAPDLLWIDVHMDEFRRRDREGIPWKPGARRPVIETYPQCQQDIGLAAGMVRLIGAASLDQTEGQRMLYRQRAEPACGSRYRNLQPLGKGE